MRMTAAEYRSLIDQRIPTQPKARKGNLGKAFQDLVQVATDTYVARGELIAVQVPTEVIVVRGSNGQIVSAKYPKERRGKVDFVGLWRGRGIAFDAKTTKQRTRFPLGNIEESQVWFLEHWARQDPRPELKQDHRYWQMLLARAYPCGCDGDKSEVKTLFYMLWGLRCCGARLLKTKTGGLKLNYDRLLEENDGAWTKEDLLNGWLKPHKQNIAAIFKWVAMIESVAM